MTSSTIISNQKFKELWTKKDRQILRAAQITLRAYGGHAIQVLGSIQVRVNVKTGQPAQTLPILVVQGNGSNLLAETC